MRVFSAPIHETGLGDITMNLNLAQSIIQYGIHDADASLIKFSQKYFRGPPA